MNTKLVVASVLLVGALGAIPVASAEDYVTCVDGSEAGYGTACGGVTNIRLVCATIDGEYVIGDAAAGAYDCAGKEPAGQTTVRVYGPA